MHCATLEISRKVDYTPVSFMLSFWTPGSYLPYLPSILRSIALLLIFPYILLSFTIIRVLARSMALVIYGFPGLF